MPFIDSFYSAKEAKKPELDRVCHNNSTCPLGRVISAHTNGGQGLAGIVSAAIVRNAIARGNRARAKLAVRYSRQLDPSTDL